MEEHVSKTIPSIYLLAAALLCLLVPPADAGSSRAAAPENIAVELTVSPVDTFVVKGHTFQLRVHIATDSTDFMGYNIAVRYDSLRLKIVSVDEGTFPPSFGYPTFFRWLNAGAGDDRIEVNGAILGHSVRGHGVLFTMTFAAVSLNIADVEILAADLRSGVNEALANTTRNALVRIISSIDAETDTWGSIKNRYR